MIPANPKRGLPSGAEIEELKNRIDNGELNQLVEAANSFELLVANEEKKSLQQFSSEDFEVFVKSHRAVVDAYLRMIDDPVS